MKDQQPRLFLARAGRNGEEETYALENGLAIIGFQDFPSLANAKDYDAIVTLVKQADPGLKPRTAGNFSGQLWAFAIAMQIGDLVVLPRKLTSQVAIGRVIGPYEHKMVNNELRHTRRVEWLRPDVPRSVFKQDLLYSFGAFMTVCNISRNGAVQRVSAVLAGQADPGFASVSGRDGTMEEIAANAEVVPSDLAQAARDRIVAHIQSHFSGHALARLVDAVLVAEGWVTKLSPPGADGGVDILAGRGSLGLDEPRLCVQVKSQSAPVDVIAYRTLQGSMQSFKAEQGLLVAWGGFNGPVLKESRQGHFMVRLWESQDLVDAIFRNYEKLDPEIQAELPLKRVWMLVGESGDV